MSIYVIELNYKTAPVDLREKFYFAPEVLPLYLQDLINSGIAKEAVFLFTCNRAGLYCNTENIDAVMQWLLQQVTLDKNQAQILQNAFCIYQEQMAVAHMMKVACGLDSMIIGEPQILGQMKAAFSESCTVGAVDTLFHRLFQHIFSVAKEIRTTTMIGACPVSVASAAVHFIKQRYRADFAKAQIVLVGAGETSELLLRYLHPQIEKPIMIVNRHLEKAASLALNYAANSSGLEELANVLTEADIVFSATGSPVPIIHADLMQAVMLARSTRDLYLMDLAVPRDIDPAVAHLPAVHAAGIDDLKIMIEQHRQGREHAARKADELILHKSAAFMQDAASLDNISHTIRAYRQQIETISQMELSKAKQYVQQGGDPLHALDHFAYALTNKLLHAPSVQIRQAGAEGRFEFLRFVKELFAIKDTEHEAIDLK